MPERTIITLTDTDGTTAVIAPELGGWLLRYARPIAKHGLVDALYCSQEIIDRWPREMYAGSPILFPLVSFNRAGDKDAHYEWNGALHEMPQHGFGRRSKWAVVDQSKTAMTMELSDNEVTRANYPFAFRQRLKYWIAGGRLHWEQVIENTGDEPMPFSSGFHPYFKVPLTSKSERSTCFIEIPEARRMVMVGKADRFAPQPFLAQNWSVEQDVADTLFLGDLKKPELILIDPGSELEVVLNWEEAAQYRFAALWAKTTETPFYCLEPWTALPNSFSRVKDREVIVLGPKQTFRAAMWMEVRPMA